MRTPERSDIQIDETVLEAMFTGITLEVVRDQLLKEGAFGSIEDIGAFYQVLLEARRYYSIGYWGYDEVVRFVDNSIPPTCQEVFSFRGFAGRSEIGEALLEVIDMDFSNVEPGEA